MEKKITKKQIGKDKNLLGLIISNYICECIDANSIVITNDQNLKIVSNDKTEGVWVWIEPLNNIDIVEEESILGLKEILKIKDLCLRLGISLDAYAIKNLDGAKDDLEYYQDELDEYLKSEAI
tara:strand:- start:16 stop:384 length:369 start_codon:yes stop_codon:yes gene_type:complete